MADVRTPEDMERLMDRYGDRMLRLCCMYLNDEHMAQDAVQDSFLKIYRNAQTFEMPEAEKSWVMRVAINTCKDYLRSAWKRRVNLMEQLPEVPAPETMPRDEAEELYQAVQALSRNTGRSSFSIIIRGSVWARSQQFCGRRNLR